MDKQSLDLQQLLKLASLLVTLIVIMLLVVLVMAGSLLFAPEIMAWINTPKKVEAIQREKGSVISDVWESPDESTIPKGEEGEDIRYGRELIVHTSKYLGPNGKVLPISNGMNCQNCHIDAGTKPFGNNYSAVAATYPKFRERSGTKETIEKRVNDCFERSLNGQALDTESREMKAMVAYIKWLGKDVQKGKIPNGAGIPDLAYMDRPASAVKGKVVYEEKCTLCHGSGGEGILNDTGTEWIYPPLWGDKSYNHGAGLFRLSRFAGYIKANMPLGGTYNKPQLTDEEAWDIAAYVNSQPRPGKDLSADWPDVSQKPVDHPFGPFTDGFSEDQHKYGPFKPILDKQKKLSKQIATVK